MGFKEAEYYKKLANKKVHCSLCPHSCFIGNGETGKCIVRQNVDGNLKSMYYAKPHMMRIISNDSVGFKHLNPKSESLVIGMVGENLIKLDGEEIDYDDVPKLAQNPSQIADEIKRLKINSMVYNYEPIVSYEYIKEIIEKSPDKKHFIITSGFVEEDVGQKLAEIINGANVALDSVGDEFYQANYGVSVEPVLKFIKNIYSNGKLIELTFNIWAGKYDEVYEIRKFVSWVLNNLDENIPVHFRIMGETENSELLKKAKSTAINAGLNYVYIDSANEAYMHENKTLCPSCKNTLIIRNPKLEINFDGEKCSCGKKVPGIWD